MKIRVKDFKIEPEFCPLNSTISPSDCGSCDHAKGPFKLKNPAIISSDSFGYIECSILTRMFKDGSIKE